MLQVLFNERRNEVIAVVIALVATNFERQTAFGTGLFEQLRFELFLEKGVGEALVDEYFAVRRSICKPARNFTGIVVVPGRPVSAEIIAERLLAPRAMQSLADRRKCRKRSVKIRVSETDCQRTVSTHRVPAQTLPAGVAREVIEYSILQLGRHIVIHMIVLRPGFFDGI